MSATLTWLAFDRALVAAPLLVVQAIDWHHHVVDALIWNRSLGRCPRPRPPSRSLRARLAGGGASQ